MAPPKVVSAHRIDKGPDKIAALRNSDFFAGLATEILEEFANCAVVSRLRRGEVLFYQDDKTQHIYVVVLGTVRSMRQNAEGREQILGIKRAGTTLCLAPAFDGETCFSGAIADEPSTVLSIEKRAFLQICGSHPVVLWNAARLLAQELRRHAQLIETLALRTVDQRVAWYLLVRARDAGVTAGRGCVFELKATRAQIAGRLGSVREVVSRSLLHLQERGLIMLSGRNVTVPSERVLREFATAGKPRSNICLPSLTA